MNQIVLVGTNLLILKRLAPFFLHILIAVATLLSSIFGYLVFLHPSKIALHSTIDAKIIGTHRKIDLIAIDKGRFRISVDPFSNEVLQLTLDTHENARFLMFRERSHLLGETPHLRISIQNGKSIDVKSPLTTPRPRYFIPLPKNQSQFSVKIQNLDPTTIHLIIEEIGLFQTQPAVKERGFYMKLILSSLGIIGILGILSCAFLNKKTSAIYGSLYFLILPMAFHFSILLLQFWSRDLRVYLASGPVSDPPSSNLSYGLYMASNILQNKGPLISGAPPWCRMPGYGYILALSGNASDLVQMAMNSVALHIALFGISLAFFFWAALRIMSPFVASFISTIVAFCPFRIFYTYIESIMPTIVLFFMGTACLFIEKYYERVKISFKYHLFLHASLAFWFFVRSDILPAWAILSLFLYARDRQTWKYLFLPAGLALSTGLSWALFKMPYTGEFVMTTNSIGASLMVGLWEIPHKFVWEVADASYYSWMKSAGYDPLTKQSSDFAIKEVAYFAAIYPMYICSLIWHKFLFFAQSFFQFVNIKILTWARLWFLTIIISSFFFKHKRFQTLLLSWILFFNVPLFFIFFASDGRYYESSNICLFAAALPLLFDKEYYKKIVFHKFKFVVLVLTAIGIAALGPSIDHYLIHADAIRYWTPFLDPGFSTLNIVKRS